MTLHGLLLDMVSKDMIERVSSAVAPTDTLVDRHLNSQEIREALIDWAQSPESERCTFKQLVAEIVDRYAQDESLGKNPESTLRYFLNNHVADKLVLSRATMNLAFVGHNEKRNLLKQHYDSLAIIDKALVKAQERVDNSEEGEGMTNLLNLIDKRESTLVRIRELEMILGNLQDHRVSKSLSVHHHEHTEGDPSLIMEQTRRRKPSAVVVDVTPKRDVPEP